MPAVTPTEPKSLPTVADASGTPRPVEQVGNAVHSFEGAGFPVRRPFPGPIDQPRTDPFLMMDQMGPVVYAPGKALGAPDHPHRGFETVTYLLDGEMEHRDSYGGGGVIRGGDTQWMTAGSGLVHSRDADREDDARGRAAARRADLGEPPEVRQAGRAALPGHHRRPAHAVPQRRRHRDRALDRG